MHCPFCNADKESLKVIDSRTCEGGRSIRRRRECLHCEKRFTTYERIEDPIKLIVVKKDGRRVPWDRATILTGDTRGQVGSGGQQSDTPGDPLAEAGQILSVLSTREKANPAEND